MKAIVLYQSHYGTTERYARWIAEELGCEAVHTKGVRPESLAPYDTVILGGGLYAGGILGSALIRKNYERLKDKKLIVYTVGLSPTDDPSIFQPALERAFPGAMRQHISFFHLRGGMRTKNLSFLHRAMMGMMRKLLEKKPENERDASDNALLALIREPDRREDFTDRATIAPLVACARGS